MIKFRLYYDKDLEQKWFNKMSDDGWALERFYFGFYYFKRCEPGEYVYQTDMLKTVNGEEYKEFMKEVNVEPVQQWFRWMILRKKKADGPFTLYTDHASLIQLYARILIFFILFTIISIVFMMIGTFIFLKTDDMLLLIPILMFAVLIFLFVRQMIRCNLKIIKLKGGINNDRKLSPLLIAGLILNAVNSISRMFWEEYFSYGVGHNISIVISVIAISMMFLGVFFQIKKLHRV